MVNGVMEYCMQNTGSKSEGKMALLKCDDGTKGFEISTQNANMFEIRLVSKNNTLGEE